MPRPASSISTEDLERELRARRSKTRESAAENGLYARSQNLRSWTNVTSGRPPARSEQPRGITGALSEHEQDI